MSHVQIDPTGIGQKSTVAGWFVVSAMMQVQHAALLHLKDMIAETMGDPRGRVFGPILIDQEPVFGFQSKNLIQHFSYAEKALITPALSLARRDAPLPDLRSQVETILNVPHRVRLRLFLPWRVLACLEWGRVMNGLFEHYPLLELCKSLLARPKKSGHQFREFTRLDRPVLR